MLYNLFMEQERQKSFVGRAGHKLDFALDHFAIEVKDKICADFGSSVGGFVDALLQKGAQKVYALETGYGQLAWRLRQDPRVIVMERTNAMHASLPQKVEILTIDTSWTKQEYILPNARKNLQETGTIITLIKPHYETTKHFSPKHGLPEEEAEKVTKDVLVKIKQMGFSVKGVLKSPLLGTKGENSEYLACLTF